MKMIGFLESKNSGKIRKKAGDCENDKKSGDLASLKQIKLYLIPQLQKILF